LNKGFRQSSGAIMAWLNSDDQYMPWAFKTVAEIFEAHPDVNWIVGTNSWFNDKGAMYLVNNVYKNVLDLVSGNFEWIQQESVFWRRSLWERAGGQINQNYRFMVDGELWTRFFRIEPLWHVHAVLSGYRMHPGNRAKLHIEECRTEMLRAIDDMRPHVDLSRLGPLQRNYPVLVYDLENLRWVKRLLRRAAQTEPPGVSG
jgi:hypothetical protein